MFILSRVVLVGSQDSRCPGKCVASNCISSSLWTGMHVCHWGKRESAVIHNFFEELLVTGTVEQVISTFNLWAVMVCEWVLILCFVVACPTSLVKCTPSRLPMLEPRQRPPPGLSTPTSRRMELHRWASIWNVCSDSLFSCVWRGNLCQFDPQGFLLYSTQSSLSKLPDNYFVEGKIYRVPYAQLRLVPILLIGS